MEIAGSIVTAIVPPAYSQGAEEAKRDTQARAQIPAPGESQASQNNRAAADRKGSAQSPETRQTAGYQGLRDDKGTIDKDGHNKNRQDGQKNQGGDSSGNEARHLGDRQGYSSQTGRQSFQQHFPRQSGVNITANAEETIALQMQAEVMGTPGTTAQLSSKSAGYASSGTPAQKEAQKSRTLKKKTTYKMAQYREKQGNSRLNTVNSAISARYNSILPNVNVGKNISLNI